MSKAVLISIRPKWCEKIVNGEKTVEVRKTRPKMKTPFKCYIYCTRDKHLALIQNRAGANLIACMDAETAIPVGGFAGNGKVIGEFTCDRIYELETKAPGGSYYVKGEDQPTTNDVARQSCLGLGDMHAYLKSKTGYGLHISRVKLYDTPRELSEFTGLRDTRFGAEPYKFKRPPLSWMYVEAVEKEEKV